MFYGEGIWFTRFLDYGKASSEKVQNNVVMYIKGS